MGRLLLLMPLGRTAAARAAQPAPLLLPLQGQAWALQVVHRPLRLVRPLPLCHLLPLC